MSPEVVNLNFLVGTGALALLIGSAVLWVDICFLKRRHFRQHIEKRGLVYATALLVSALLLALTYSEYFGFAPCGLCWMMRIFVFSQAFIMPFALIRRDESIAFYGLVLSVPGICIGLYQHYLQLGGDALIPCPAAAGDCAKRILFEYNFITFPLVGVSMLLFVTAIYVYLLKKDRF